MKSRVKEKRINLLDLVPVRNVQWEKNDKGLVTLLKPKFKKPFLQKHLLPHLKNPHYRIKLDTIGSFIWELCNGSLTVNDLAQRLKSQFGDSVEPLYDRLALFLQGLEKNHFIYYKGK